MLWDSLGGQRTISVDCDMPFPVPSSRTLFSGCKPLQCVLCFQTYPWEVEVFTK